MSTPPEQDQAYRYRNWFTLGILEMNVLHRFRNLLMSMMGNVSFVREELKNGRAPDKFLDDLEASLTEASNYSNWVQSFGERQKAALVTADLNAIITDCVEVLEQDVCFPLELQLKLDRSIPRVAVDPLLFKLSLWELLHQYCQTRGTNGASTNPSLHLQTRLIIKESSNSIRKKEEKCVELIIESRGLKLPFSQSVPRETGPIQKTTGNPALEITKSIMRLFHGELKFSVEDPLCEKTSLSFPIES